ncbi:MAG: hypothetical protein AB7Q23_10085 [Hyphomonadaceae bacterium]
MKGLLLFLAVAGLLSCASLDVRSEEAQADVVSSANGDVVSLSFLAGDWVLHDASGVAVGVSHIEVSGSNAVLFEQRTIGTNPSQPLWLMNSERAGGWVQLFLNPSQQVREFTTQSDKGAWPLILGGEFELRNGTLARFRLTITQESEALSRRLLEMSRDGGATWAPVLDYTYRRA